MDRGDWLLAELCLVIDLRICVHCSFHQASLNCGGNMILEFLIFLMLTKRYIDPEGLFSTWDCCQCSFLTTTLQAVSPTVQIYSACFLTNHSPTLDSWSMDLPWTFLSPWSPFITLHLINLWSPAIRGPICVEILAQQIPRQQQHQVFHVVHHFLCYRSLFHVPLMLAIWEASVFKLPSSHSTDNQITCLIFLFFY